MRCLPAIVAVALALVLAGCNVANVKPADPGAQAPGTAPPTSATASNAAAAPQTAAPATPPRTQSSAVSNETLSSRLDRISGRLALVQEQVGKLKEQGQQQTELGQAVLARLQLLTQARTVAASDAAPSDPSSGQLDAAIGQLMQTVNDLNNTDTTHYGVASTYTAKGAWILLRYRTDTGETWIADKGAWKPLQDKDSLPASRYLVQVRRADQDLKGYVAVRVDQNSGKSWWLNSEHWQVYE